MGEAALIIATLGVITSVNGVSAQGLGPMAMDSYHQEIIIPLASTEAAQKAAVKMLPLYRGAEWAISSRWDDNVLTDLKMRDVLSQHGYKGTFYLNGTDSYYYGPDYGYFDQGQDHRGMGRRLLEGGHSLGAHSMSHPHLPAFQKNRIFEEIVRCRADRESSADTAINSYAFAFASFVHGQEGTDAQEDISETLRRSGIYHIANHWYMKGHEADFEYAALLPPDGSLELRQQRTSADIDEDMASWLDNKAWHGSHPNISFNMHVWYTTPKAWDKFEGQLKTYGGRSDWWYCNQNEYAAYRYQAKYSEIKTHPRGKDLVVELRRPHPWDLNDGIPLSLELLGVGERDLRTDSFGDGRVKRFDRGKALGIHASHDPEWSVPTRVAYAGLDEPLGDLKAEISVHKEKVRLSVRHAGTDPLGEVRATLRIPLAWEPGVARKSWSSLKPGQTVKFELPLKRRGLTGRYLEGSAFFLAQLDYQKAGQCFRTYASYRMEAPRPSASYPGAALRVLGPLDEDPSELLKALPGMAADQSLNWRTGPVKLPDKLSPEIVETVGNNRRDDKGRFLIVGQIDSPKRMEVRALVSPTSVQAVYLNGKELGSRPGELSKGRNDLWIIYDSGEDIYSMDHYGCFLRIVDADRGEEIPGLRYFP